MIVILHRLAVLSFDIDILYIMNSRLKPRLLSYQRYTPIFITSHIPPRLLFIEYNQIKS